MKIKLFAPEYYNEFKCIADRCTHSCCIGWEIDVDGDTVEKYESLPAEEKKYVNDIVLENIKEIEEIKETIIVEEAHKSEIPLDVLLEYNGDSHEYQITSTETISYETDERTLE